MNMRHRTKAVAQSTALCVQLFRTQDTSGLVPSTISNATDHHSEWHSPSSSGYTPDCRIIPTGEGLVSKAPGRSIEPLLRSLVVVLGEFGQDCGRCRDLISGFGVVQDRSQRIETIRVKCGSDLSTHDVQHPLERQRRLIWTRGTERVADVGHAQDTGDL